jgi:imidazolonepropionase
MATLNAAASLGLGADRGSLTPGKRADLVIWSVPEHGMVINRFGINCVDTVIADGLMVVRSGRRIEGSCAPDTH